VFRPAKLGFAGVAKNLSHRSLLPPLDPVVQIFERPAQLFAQGSAHAALTGTHEADQHDCPRLWPQFAGGSFAAKLASHGPFDQLLRPFAPVRFAFRFDYCFSERFLR
jgi:hypothetical protein